MNYFLSILLGWIAYFLDLMIVSAMSSHGSQISELYFLYLGRSVVYIAGAYFVIRSQMAAEGLLRSLGANVASVDQSYWYATICQNIPHHLLPSVLRIVSEAVPLMGFIFVISLTYPEIVYVFYGVGLMISLYLGGFYIVQSWLSRSASIQNEKYISSVTFVNEVEKTTFMHHSKKKYFLKEKKSAFIRQFVNINSASVGLSQTVRYQIELVAVTSYVLFFSDASVNAAILYVMYRAATSATQIISIITGIGQYRFYWYQAKKINPSFNFMSLLKNEYI